MKSTTTSTTATTSTTTTSTTTTTAELNPVKSVRSGRFNSENAIAKRDMFVLPLSAVYYRVQPQFTSIHFDLPHLTVVYTYVFETCSSSDTVDVRQEGPLPEERIEKMIDAARDWIVV